MPLTLHHDRHNRTISQKSNTGAPRLRAFTRQNLLCDLHHIGAGDVGTREERVERLHFSNFGSLKSTETEFVSRRDGKLYHFSNFGSLKSTETREICKNGRQNHARFQQFRLVEEH